MELRIGLSWGLSPSGGFMRARQFGGLVLVAGIAGVGMGCADAKPTGDQNVLDTPTAVDFALRPGVVDPGPRAGAPGAGSAFPGLTAAELESFADG